MGFLGIVVCGWLSKLGSLFGSLFFIRHLLFRVRHFWDHNFDNYPCGVRSTDLPHTAV